MRALRASLPTATTMMTVPQESVVSVVILSVRHGECTQIDTEFYNTPTHSPIQVNPCHTCRKGPTYEVLFYKYLLSLNRLDGRLTFLGPPPPPAPKTPSHPKPATTVTLCRAL